MLEILDKYHEKDKFGHTRSLVRCDCGNIFVTRWGSIKDGDTRSCGCLLVRFNQIELQNTKHGHNSRKLGISPTYRSWLGMKDRCTNKTHVGWKYYGGRGIRVCKRWKKSFTAFLCDMGERPEGTSLDRINVNGHYTPKNCRWTTASVQARNKRKQVR